VLYKIVLHDIKLRYQNNKVSQSFGSIFRISYTPIIAYETFCWHIHCAKMFCVMITGSCYIQMDGIFLGVWYLLSTIVLTQRVLDYRWASMSLISCVNSLQNLSSLESIDVRLLQIQIIIIADYLIIVEEYFIVDNRLIWQLSLCWDLWIWKIIK